jgi:hypothetical protein
VLKRAATIVGLLVLAIVLPVAGWIAFHLDDPPIDDADLRIAYPPLSDRENGAPLLDALAARVQWPEEENAWERAKALLAGKAWDEALARDLLAKNEGLLPEAERIVAMHRIQVRPREPYSSELDQGWNWCRMTSVYALRAIAAARHGDSEGAREDVARMLRFARAVEAAERADTTLLAAAGCVRRQARRALGAVLASASPGAEASRRWTAELEALRPLPSSWRAALAEDYVARSAVLRTRPPKEWHVPGNPWWTPDRYLFKPNASDQLWAEHTRRLQRWSEKPCSVAPAPALVPESSHEAFRLLLSPNGGGKLGFAIALPYSLELADHRCRIESDHAALVALVAVRAYEVEHDSLPSSLEALIPRYIDQLPRDGFDGAPLPYDAERRLLWTIAREREDKSKMSLDFEFAIPF